MIITNISHIPLHNGYFELRVFIKGHSTEYFEGNFKTIEDAEDYQKQYITRYVKQHIEYIRDIYSDYALRKPSIKYIQLYGELKSTDVPNNLQNIIEVLKKWRNEKLKLICFDQSISLVIDYSKFLISEKC